jgi:rare lipoprotein A
LVRYRTERRFTSSALFPQVRTSLEYHGLCVPDKTAQADFVPIYSRIIFVSFRNGFSGYLIAVMIGVLALSGCDSEKPAHQEVGKASWYGPGFNGRKTASGETFDQNAMTAAHQTLPMGTKANVTNLDNGKKIEVTINDRGPFAKGRVIDLSHEAASKLDMEKDGTAQVKIETKPVKH